MFNLSPPVLFEVGLMAALDWLAHTGGLADTVIDARHHTHSGTGFTFRDPTPHAFWRAVSGALEAYRDKPRWRKMMRRGMREVHAWEVSARAYIALYGSLQEGHTPRAA